MRAETFDIHCVICTHGPVRVLSRTLKSLAEVRRPGNFQTFWVVENGSDSGAHDVCRDMSNCIPLQYVHLPARGKSRALQSMLERLGSGLVVFTDDDVRVNADWLEAYDVAARQHGEQGFYGGPIEIDYEAAPPEWLRRYLPPSAAGWRAKNPDASIERPCFLGANYGGFVETLLQVGGFDASLGVGSEGNPIGEEFEIQQRLLDAGCCGIYVPDAVVWHWVPHERCSPRWTLERHERIFFTNGLGETMPLPGPRVKGVPRWMWRRLAKLAMRATVGRLTTNAHRRFERLKDYYQYRGYLRGLRMAARRASREGRDHG